MWKDHIRVIEIKISKNLGLPYKTKKKKTNADALKFVFLF